MANYANLKATINANIKANGNQEITGPVLNSVITDTLDALGAGYQFKGVATTSTSPGTPDEKVVYVAQEQGTYANFGGASVLRGEIAFFVGTGSSWAKLSVPWGLDVERYVWSTDAGTSYNDDGSVTLGTIRLRDLATNATTDFPINATFSPIPGTTSYFVLVRGTGEVSVVEGHELRRHHVILLIRATSGNVVGGDLFPDYIYRRVKSSLPVSHTIRPKLEIGLFSITAGAFAASWYGKNAYRTGLIRCTSSYVLQAEESDLQYRVLFYDKDRAFLSYVDFADLTSGGVTVSVPRGTQFTTICFRKAPGTGEDIPIPHISLTGEFPDDYEAFFPRPTSGYQRLIIPVNVADPTSADEKNIALQDQENLMVDYGLLALPAQYRPDGQPTRLIIYCHGAGVNYSTDVSAFPSTDLRPEYWLAEGCAVMDIEGNPYNNVDEHFYAPCARQSYLAAYDWVLRHYNIRRDGVFLGGRSMGGGMCFELLQSRIPVIAACPLAPGGLLPQKTWNYMTAARRSFCAMAMGFTGTAPTWTSQKPMTTAEYNYVFDTNWDKVVKYCPLWRGIESLPDRETLLSPGNITDQSEIEAALYNSQHLKVKAPVKIFAAEDDETVAPYTIGYLNQMLLNAAQVFEMRWCPSGGHHFELTEPYLLDTYTTTYGETLTDVPLIYVEMLQFWRRYELNY